MHFFPQKYRVVIIYRSIVWILNNQQTKIKVSDLYKYMIKDHEPYLAKV